MSVTNKVKKIIKRILDERYNELKDHHLYKDKTTLVKRIYVDDKLCEYGYFDSMCFAELICLLEESFSIELVDEDLAKMKKVADIITIVKSHFNNKL